MSTNRHRRAFVVTAFASLACGCNHHDAANSAPVRADESPRADGGAGAAAVAHGAAATTAAADGGSDAGAVAAAADASVRLGVFAALGADAGAPGGEFGGLGAMGVGEGGGRMGGPGSLGLGNIGASGGRMGGGQGYGSGVGGGRMGGRRGSGGAQVRPAAPTVHGPLAMEAARRVVLRNLGQVAHCYEQGLAQNPQLAGRVVVRFAVGVGGAVVGSTVLNSNVAVPSVATCIANAVRRWQFPAESSGVTTVDYPFNLQPPE